MKIHSSIALALVLLSIPLTAVEAAKLARIPVPSAREKALVTAREVVALKNEDLENSLNSARNIFLRQSNLPAPVVESGPDAPVQEKAAPVETAPVRYSDEQAVRIIAQNLRPTGSIIQGTRRILTLDGGTRMEEGSSFAAKIREQSYQVTLQQVTSDAFTLSINDATATIPFNKAARGISRE